MNPDVIADCLRYLQRHGFPEKALSTIHHLTRPEAFKRSIDYFSGVSFVRGNNESYGKRLQYIVESHKRGRGNFSELISEALEKWPLRR